MDDHELTNILNQLSNPVKLEGTAVVPPVSDATSNEPQPYFSQVDNSHMSDASLMIEDAIRQIRLLQGVLVYRGNRLVRRLESVIGEDDD